MPTDDRIDSSDNPKALVDADGIPRIEGLSTSRRSFLQLAGFSFAGAALAGCSRGEEHDIVPFLEKPEEVTAGTSIQLASLCNGCDAGCGILATSRDGRPIKIEGNGIDPISRGGTCAAGQASLLSLYDTHRLANPYRGESAQTWEVVDDAVKTGLAGATRGGKSIRLLTGTLNGPTAAHAIDGFLAAHAGATHVSYDAISNSALLDAHAEMFGRRTLPRYQIQHAQTLVSVDADFLGTWISPTEHTRDWASARRLQGNAPGFCHHTQFESRLSLTGTNADVRHRVLPQELALVVAGIAERVLKRKGKSAPWGTAPSTTVEGSVLDAVAQRLVDAPSGRALFLCGLNDTFAQAAAAYVNHVLRSDDPKIERRTVDLAAGSSQRTGDDQALAALVADMRAGKVGVLIIGDCNPVYDLPGHLGFAEALNSVPTVVSLARYRDETASAATLICPDHHAYESWRDAEPVDGQITVGQPLLQPLKNTRSWTESLAAWRSAPKAGSEIMRAAWTQRVFPRRSGAQGFEPFFARALHDGIVALKPRTAAAVSANTSVLRTAPGKARALPKGALALVLYPKVGVGDGRHALNPWLQELPDPISKVSWDNYACLSPATADGLGLADGSLVALSADGDKGKVMQLPVMVQRGQADGTVAVALGYGRLGTDRFANVGPEWIEGRSTVQPGSTIGANAAPFLAFGADQRGYAATAVTLRSMGTTSDLARTQIYDSLEVPRHLAAPGKARRYVAQDTTLDAWRDDPKSGAHEHPKTPELWAEDHRFKGHHWGLSIDLSACTGCAACVVACQSENNIPVVGKDEVQRQREMHWLRIDRYMQGGDDDLHTIHQPMMCQQCDHAPCETVCPVLATVHSSEGLNQQVYNRCVGTRYCSNNCPYKVRRFNWFEYARDDKLENMSLNPDVTVRSRGVMEKCTFCVQRIQAAKAEATREGREVREGDIQTACMQACPAGAVIFGDMNDTQSGVADDVRSPRAFRVLDEIGIRPSVTYLRQVQDRPASAKEKHHG